MNATSASPPVLDAAAQAALQVIIEGTASETGERFFMALVETLARALGTRGAWVTELLPVERRLRALAFWREPSQRPSSVPG